MGKSLHTLTILAALAVASAAEAAAGGLTVDDPVSNGPLTVVRPNGGELFVHGDQCTVLVTATKATQVVLSLDVYDLRHSVTLPGFEEEGKPISPSQPYETVFTIDSTFMKYDPATKAWSTVSLVSDTCAIMAMEYGTTEYDASDGMFSIQPATVVLRPVQSSRRRDLSCIAGIGRTVFDVRGRVIASVSDAGTVKAFQAVVGAMRADAARPAATLAIVR
jgi:hypothetical protein